MTSDKVETLMTRLIPGSRAPFFDFDAANELGPAHCMKLSSGEGENGLRREVQNINANEKRREGLCDVDLREVEYLSDEE